VARAGKGKRWQYQLGVGRVRVPGKRRAKGPGYGTIRRRMSRGGGASRRQEFSAGKAMLALMTGGISLIFTGSPFGRSNNSLPKNRSPRRTRVHAIYEPARQVDISSRIGAQLSRAQARLEEIELELEETRQELWMYESSNQSSLVRTRKLRIAQLSKMRTKWLEQLEMLRD